MVKQSDIIIMDDKPVSTTGVSAVKMCWTSIKLTVSQKVANKQLKCHKKSKNILKFNNYNKQLPIPFVNHYFNPDAWETAISIPTHGKPLFQFDAWETIISIPTRGKPLFQFWRVKIHYRISSPICRAIFSIFDTKVWEIGKACQKE